MDDISLALALDGAVTRYLLSSFKGPSRIVLEHCAITLLRMPEGTLLILRWLPEDRFVTLLFSRILEIVRRTHQLLGPSLVVCAWKLENSLNFERLPTETIIKLYGSEG